MLARFAFFACLMVAPGFGEPSRGEGPRPVLRVSGGVVIEPIYEIPKETHGSWVSLAADERGTLYASDQYGPLYRIERNGRQFQSSVEPIGLPIGGVHGLAWNRGELFAVVGERDVCRPGLYRLSDINGDGQLDRLKQLALLDGSGEHGPHAVSISPDGQSLFVLAGNATALPPLERSRVPRAAGTDSLSLLAAVMGSETRGKEHGGWICRTDREASEWELVCCGLRNAYALAMDREGELFTCDSDTEFEFGTPWYRPNRVLHCVSGADFGWRSGAQKIPEHAPDAAPPVCSIGAGSPTVVLCGSGADVPARFQNALFVADWSFGRLLAVHLRSRGASFKARIEELASGTPLAIAAACVSPSDKAIYFVTGGRKTQSVLYRMTFSK